MKEVGLFFGTFNPIHIGHLILAQFLAEYGELDEVWFVITPKSPFKQKQSLLDDHHRYHMVLEAIEGYPKLKASKIEFGLPQPNYTYITLAHLVEKYGLSVRFHLIMGEDNLKSFHKWKNYETILERHSLVVYPRVGEGNIPPVLLNHPKIRLVNAPKVEISSTFIRKAIQEQKDVRPMLPPAVWKYIDEMNFYK